ncbi:hypothetical protein QZH41_003245 [Actinostola sp. cb2023]|nr:hypothetical protein QZH41_003245 [Actinostola sp. cb2023]
MSRLQKNTSWTFKKKTIEESKVVLIDTKHSQVLGNGCSRFSNLLMTGETDFSKVLERQSQVQFDDLAVVTLTSGSTGEPKAVVRTHHSIVNSTLVASKFEFGIDFDPDSKQSTDRLFSDRPFYWQGGIMPIQIALSTGCTLLTAPPIKTVKECDIEFLLKLLQNERCTNAILMECLVVDIANYSSGQMNYDLSCLKAALTTGQPIPNHIFEKVRSVAPNCKLINAYAMTECSAIAGQVLGQQEGEEELELMCLSELKIVDENIQVLPVGQVGEICLRSPTAFLEYLLNPDATSKTISRTGWVHTGDLGKMNSRGRITITGRKDDMIKRATVKIFPVEVEKVLTKYDNVKDASVVGVPDVRLYEELCACIIPKKGSALESDMADFEKWMSQTFTPDEQGLTLKPKTTAKTDQEGRTVYLRTRAEISIPVILKESMAKTGTLAYFDKTSPTKIVADASPVGLGAVLLQKQDGQWTPVYYASRSLTECEQKYSQTEKEALALVWSCERPHAYVYGIRFDLETDHKPLEIIYGRRSKPYARIERWVLRLQPYDFHVVYIPGKKNIADPLSRLLNRSTKPDNYDHDAEEYVSVSNLTVTMV